MKRLCSRIREIPTEVSVARARARARARDRDRDTERITVLNIKRIYLHDSIQELMAELNNQRASRQPDENPSTSRF